MLRKIFWLLHSNKIFKREVYNIERIALLYYFSRCVIEKLELICIVGRFSSQTKASPP